MCIHTWHWKSFNEVNKILKNAKWKNWIPRLREIFLLLHCSISFSIDHILVPKNWICTNATTNFSFYFFLASIFIFRNLLNFIKICMNIMNKFRTKVFFLPNGNSSYSPFILASVDFPRTLHQVVNKNFRTEAKILKTVIVFSFIFNRPVFWTILSYAF